MSQKLWWSRRELPLVTGVVDGAIDLVERLYCVNDVAWAGRGPGGWKMVGVEWDRWKDGKEVLELRFIFGDPEGWEVVADFSELPEPRWEVASAKEIAE